MPATHATLTTLLPDREHQPAGTDERILLLKDIGFKWLMAGQGWWIDTARLHNDPTYAAQWLELMESTGLPALKDCAQHLRAQVSRCH